jgi:hypothetical protein
MSDIKPLSFFDFLTNINEGSKAVNLMEACSADDSSGALNSTSIDKQYVAFMINRGLSYFNDTILLANEMNRHHSLPTKMQYDFYRGLVRPRKRFSKWAKKEDDSADVKLIMEHYDYSSTRAREVLPLLGKESIEAIKAIRNKGGVNK